MRDAGGAESRAKRLEHFRLGLLRFKSPGRHSGARAASAASEPGIHNHRREYGFRTCSLFELAIRNDDDIWLDDSILTENALAPFARLACKSISIGRRRSIAVVALLDDHHPIGTAMLTAMHTAIVVTAHLGARTVAIDFLDDGGFRRSDRRNGERGDGQSGERIAKLHRVPPGKSLAFQQGGNTER
ncbi:hypothetical protein RPC_4852 [Rhodopseudomonas palustris BisB18]|uniref:Uncharacterized protein n=1 Tax=Rhodopseudomonas palustris (strain BisB18) TaxID=316056 RepID=Q20WW2_RHOPB